MRLRRGSRLLLWQPQLSGAVSQPCPAPAPQRCPSTRRARPPQRRPPTPLTGRGPTGRSLGRRQRLRQGTPLRQQPRPLLRVATGAAAAARGPGPRARKRAPARRSHNFPAVPRAAVGALRPNARLRCPSGPGPASRSEHRPPHASAFPGGCRARRTRCSRLLRLQVPGANRPFSLLLSHPSPQPALSFLLAPTRARNI